MEKQQLEARIAEALDKHRIGAFATVEGGRPKIRYMAVFHEGLNIYLATDRKTHKVEELRTNPAISLLLGYDGEQPSQIVEIEGTADITKDNALRGRLWNERLRRWFNGPDDPDYVILAIAPAEIHYFDEASKQQVWKPK
ncbi:pyridoxamine 5'-phosphate oxidase family protein [Paenibacillus sp. T1]|uniref:Pyridoxamine 5'-phosphate oxidase family protein n=2 Tax=Paenibacillus glycinis TaxID=2697035 RepID=A0ABW9XMY6_9BACL|nr:pyridoxamine 5'-phosphate oxidase family protein [Paenibacillus glycinis]